MDKALILTVVTGIFSGTGILSFLFSYRERKATTKLTDANTVKVIQGIYAQLVTDLENEMKQLKEEVYMLRKVVESYKKTCDGCPHNVQKEKHDAGSNTTPAP